jgi:hypothetical protein
MLVVGVHGAEVEIALAFALGTLVLQPRTHAPVSPYHFACQRAHVTTTCVFIALQILNNHADGRGQEGSGGSGTQGASTPRRGRTCSFAAAEVGRPTPSSSASSSASFMSFCACLRGNAGG